MSHDGSRFWSRAAAFGALWAALEITVGAFIHTVRLPLGGVLLSAAGALILVAQRQLYPQRGLTLATGLIAALGKTLSPGGMIFGPMVAITIESLLVEIAFLPHSRSLFLAMLGGALAAAWSVLQGLFSQLIFFGSDILALYFALLKQLTKICHVPLRSGFLGAAIALLLISSVGALGGAWGWRIGRICKQNYFPNREAEVVS